MLIYNTQSQRKELFKAINSESVTMYTCGPTVYSSPHIGNMRAYVHADLIKTILIDDGYIVNHVINITDVGHLTSDADIGDDKMEKQAIKEGVKSFEIAKKYEKEFLDDMEALNISLPTHMPRATEYIKEQINLIKLLEEKEYTYKTSDGVYFNTLKIKNYADIAQIGKEGIIEGFRVDMGEKKNGTDFALWKFSPKQTKRDMEWNSPWGLGFPGWHIECSAMAKSLLGKHIDIHTGGIDHIHVHHAAEIAQSTAAHNQTMANYWSHVNFLLTDEKMSKSKGNIITVENLKDKGIDPMVLKFFYYLSHYRSELSFSMDLKNIEKAKKSYLNLNKKSIALLKEENNKTYVNFDIIKRFGEILRDDLNTPMALAFVFTTLKDETINNLTKLELMKKLDSILKLNIFSSFENEIPPYILKLAEKRWLLKIEKKWKEADKTRKEIESNGYTIEDTKDKYKIRQTE
jgi:cysteinyl-tRNA synthetase